MTTVIQRLMLVVPTHTGLISGGKHRNCQRATSVHFPTGRRAGPWAILIAMISTVCECPTQSVHRKDGERGESDWWTKDRGGLFQAYDLDELANLNAQFNDEAIRSGFSSGKHPDKCSTPKEPLVAMAPIGIA
jgi:hypothetical protein